MEYMQTLGGVKRDELIGGLYPHKIFNIDIGAGNSVKRGDLLAAANFTATFTLATASDTAKCFAVAVDDYSATATNTIIQGYVSGTFNREKLNPSDTAILDALEPAMRRQNMNLTSLKKYFVKDY